MTFLLIFAKINMVIVMKDLKVIFMGTPDFSVAPLEYLIENTNVVLVVTQPDKETGRSKELTMSPVKKVAMSHGIDVFQPVKIRKEYEIISEINPDLIITCAYGQILPKALLDIPRLGCINIHGSLLPKYRGASPIQSAILMGETKTGITLMYMDETMDTGDIISKIEVPILDTDDTGSLFAKMSESGVKLLGETLPKIYEGTNERIKQDENEATYTKMIKREDEKIDFNESYVNIINKIRALSPFPGAYFTYGNIDIKVFKASFVKGNSTIGKITYNKKEMLIGCKDGNISLEIIKPTGKKQMEISAFLNGAKKDIEYAN